MTNAFESCLDALLVHFLLEISKHVIQGRVHRSLSGRKPTITHSGTIKTSFSGLYYYSLLLLWVTKAASGGYLTIVCFLNLPHFNHILLFVNRHALTGIGR